MTGDDYDLMLHCTIGHMHRVDGAEPDFDDGVKTLTLLAPLTQPRCIFCIFVILCIFCIFLTYYGLQTKGLSFISIAYGGKKARFVRRGWRGSTPRCPAGYVRHDHSATVSI